MKRLLIGALLFALAAAPMTASTFLAMTETELIADSEAVVQGEVVKVRSFWDATGRMVMTEALVRVEDTILGKAPALVRVETFGGNVDGFIVEAAGFPQFKAGERMVLFLSRPKEGVARVSGYQFGQYRIERNKAGVEFAVPALDAGVTVVTKDGTLYKRPQAVRLDTFKDQVRDTARRSGRIAN
ncbi:MAG: hypothetical protein ACLGI9_01720 [Thermoanaerobaculia bacterium]